MKVQRESERMQRIHKIMDTNDGLIKTSDLVSYAIPRSYLQILKERGEVIKVSTGVYRKANHDTFEDDMLIFQERWKAAVFSHETALYLHDLTDRTPLHYSVTVPQNYNSEHIKRSGTKITYAQPALLAWGIEEKQTAEGNMVKATDLERTVCDVVKKRHKLDQDVLVEALKRYVRHNDRDIQRLYRYAEKLRVRTIISKYIEVLL